MHGEDEGKRLVRGDGKKAKVSRSPRWLIEAAPGAVVFIPVRVGAHFAGPGGGEYTDTLCQVYEVDGRYEIYRCGDLYIKRSMLVGAYQLEE